MSNIVNLVNKNSAEYLANEVCEGAQEAFIDLIERLSPNGESDLKGILLFLLKCTDITRGIIDVIANSAEFDEFDRSTRQHFAMQADTMLDDLIAHAKKAKRKNAKNI